jgi:hypothetical protein
VYTLMTLDLPPLRVISYDRTNDAEVAY